MTGGSFTTGSKAPEMWLLPSHRIWELEVLSPLITILRDVFQILVKEIPRL